MGGLLDLLDYEVVMEPLVYAAAEPFALVVERTWLVRHFHRVEVDARRKVNLTVVIVGAVFSLDGHEDVYASCRDVSVIEIRGVRSFDILWFDSDIEIIRTENSGNICMKVICEILACLANEIDCSLMRIIGYEIHIRHIGAPVQSFRLIDIFKNIISDMSV